MKPYIQTTVDYILENRKMADLHDLPSCDRAIIIGEYLAEHDDEIGECYEGISMDVLKTAMHAMGEGDTDTLGLILSVALANSPHASDILAWCERQAREYLDSLNSDENIRAGLADDAYTNKREGWV